MREDPVDPLVEEEARTIDEFVEHPRRQVIWELHLDVTRGFAPGIDANQTDFRWVCHCRPSLPIRPARMAPSINDLFEGSRTRCPPAVHRQWTKSAPMASAR